MNPSEVDKGNQDEKRIAPIVIKLDLFELILKSQRVLAERFEQRWWSVDYTGFVVYFSRLWAPMNPKLRLRSAKPSELQMSRSRFC
jgi:hypothetical protein